jgi:hypothetical protein
MKIYPNPANDKVNIVNLWGQSALLKIYDLMGTVVKNEIIHGDKKEINVEDLSVGVYVLEFTSNDKSLQEKLIIQR